MARILPPLVPLVLVAAIMEWLVSSGRVPSYILPAPSEVLLTLQEDGAAIWRATASTLLAAVLGLGASFVTGFVIALVLSLSNFARKALYPYAVFFQTVPVVAIAPVLVIWFGYGMPTVVASAFICSVFPVIASASLGLRSTDPALVDLFRLYGASPLRILLGCRVPAALPQILAGLRIASGLAVIGAIVGEFIGGGGLGSIVDAARTQQRLDKVFGAVLASALLGMVLVGAVDRLSALLLGRWHASEKTS